MNRKKKILIALMIVITLAVSVSETMAYFSTYVRAKGTKPISMSDSTRIKEETVEGGKHVVITAAEDSNPVYVRLRVYALDEVLAQLDYTGDGWTYDSSEDWWYYGSPLHGSKSAELDVRLKEGAQIEAETFNVIVVYEFIPATMGDDGTLYPDWNASWIIEEGTTNEGN